MEYSGDSAIGLKNEAAQPPKSKQNLETLIIEDLNGLREKGFKGKLLLLNFVQQCILRKDITVKEICKRFKI